MKTTQIVLSILVLLFISCKDDDDVNGNGEGNSQPSMTKSSTIITQEPIYNGYQAWGLVTDDDGKTLGYKALQENQESQIQYEVPINYAGKIHFSLYQLSDGQQQAIQLRTFSDIADEPLYLKSEQEGISSNHNQPIQITLDGINPENILSVIVIPDDGFYNKSTQLESKSYHSIVVNENDRRFFIAVLVDNDTWKYDYIEPAADEQNLKLFPNDFQFESENSTVNAESDVSWRYELAGIVEGNTTGKRNYICRYSSQDTFYNAIYNIKDASDISIPAVLLEEYDQYRTYYSIGRPANNLAGGYSKIVVGNPQVNINPTELDYMLKHNENNFVVEAMSDYTYTNTSWIKHGDESLNKNTSWHWDVYGSVNHEIVFPIFPAELSDQIHDKIEGLNEFDHCRVYVAKDSKFSSYQFLLEEILNQAENKNKIFFPFSSLEYSLDREIEVSYTVEEL